MVAVALTAASWADEPHPAIRRGLAHPYYALKAVDGGEPFILDRFRGKKVIVLHLAPWDPESVAQLPVWEKFAKEYQSGPAVFVGVIHEAYPDRAALFARWKKISFPLYFDPLNIADARRMARAVCVDEFGIVQSIAHDPSKLSETFISKTFKLDRSMVRPPIETLRKYKQTKRVAGEARRCFEYIENGDTALETPIAAMVKEAIDSYKLALGDQPKDAAAMCRLGIAYRIRYDLREGDSPSDDLDRSLAALSAAVRFDPKNQVSREWLLRYAAPSDKQWNSCGWIEAAEKAVGGGTLDPPPTAIEMAAPMNGFHPDRETPEGPPEASTSSVAIKVDSGIVRVPDTKIRGLVNVLFALAPGEASTFEPEQSVRVWITPPAGVEVEHRMIEAEVPKDAGPGRPVHMSVAARLPDGAPGHVHVLKCVAVFQSNGVPVRFEFDLPVPATAPDPLRS